MSNMRAFKDRVRSMGGKLQNVGYITTGDSQVAHVEAVGLSVNMCRTLEQEFHFVEFDGVRGRHMELTVDMSVER